jgi:hypothetical protein
MYLQVETITIKIKKKIKKLAVEQEHSVSRVITSQLDHPQWPSCQNRTSAGLLGSIVITVNEEYMLV